MFDTRKPICRLCVTTMEAHLGAHHKMPCATCDVKQATITSLTARLAACREALERYGKHHTECCCGLDKALAQEREG